VGFCSVGALQPLHAVRVPQGPHPDLGFFFFFFKGFLWFFFKFFKFFEVYGSGRFFIFVFFFFFLMPFSLGF
jgi:hypothetical protein